MLIPPVGMGVGDAGLLIDAPSGVAEAAVM
jgi:hypothetical protein